jgi:hypothetical protein
MKKVLLNRDKFLSSRSTDEDLLVSLVNGDVALITMSENGHDAEAIQLSVGSRAIQIPAGNWYTIETLGIESEFNFDKEKFTETIAPPDWRPVPRPSNIN